jgi:hypothetical protein
MIYTMSGTEALARRHTVKSPGTGIDHWGTEFFGPRSSTSVAPGPQATMSEMNANETIVPHFHGTTQFQIFAAGFGKIGRGGDTLQPLTLQFKDHHTAYGPVVAGPQGLTFMALRIKTGDSAPVYLDKPGYRDKLKPSKKRNLISSQVGLSIEPVMQYRKEATWEPLFGAHDIKDEMAAHMVRLGAGMAVGAPDPAACGGYYLFVANGNLNWAGTLLPRWSMVVVEPDEAAVDIRAGDTGLEVLVMQFPRDDWEA